MNPSDLLRQLTNAVDAGEDALAISTLSTLLAHDPNHAEAHWQAGRFFGRKGALTEAAGEYRAAVAADPRLSSAEFAVRGQTIVLRDIIGSTMPAHMLEEVGRGMYALLDRTFAAGDVILDIGAHIGTVSIILAKLHPQARIFAYEPSASNFQMLTENLRANDIGNVTAVHAAVSGERGRQELIWAPTLTGGATLCAPDAMRDELAAQGWQRETITCVTLDDVFAQHRIEHCAFLKLDCEGAEWDIVRSSTVLGQVRRIAMELHLPASRKAEGHEALQAEFADLVRRHTANMPEIVVSSTVWANYR